MIFVSKTVTATSMSLMIVVWNLVILTLWETQYDPQGILACALVWDLLASSGLPGLSSVWARGVVGTWWPFLSQHPVSAGSPTQASHFMWGRFSLLFPAGQELPATCVHHHGRSQQALAVSAVSCLKFWFSFLTVGMMTLFFNGTVPFLFLT